MMMVILPAMHKASCGVAAADDQCMMSLKFSDARRRARVSAREVVMAGLVPAIHVLPAQKERRGCPAQGRA